MESENKEIAEALKFIEKGMNVLSKLKNEKSLMLEITSPKGMLNDEELKIWDEGLYLTGRIYDLDIFIKDMRKAYFFSE